MIRILVIFASEEGQTSKIAHRLCELLREQGAEVAVRDATKPEAGDRLSGYDGVIIGSAIHYGHHAKPIRELVKSHRAILRTRQTAFFSVSLSAGGPLRDAAAAKRHLDEFSAETGWKPDYATSFAGAIRHSRYGILKTLLVRLSMRQAGTPEPGDHEYTNWKAVADFGEVFLRRVEARRREA